MKPPKIDKGIPVPWGRFQGRDLPYHQLEVGDSFFVPNISSNQLGSSMNYFRNKLKPKKFTCRTVTEKGVKGVRIWRIA